MNIYSNSWPEEQQHLQRQKDLIREADGRRLVRLARQGQVKAVRAPRNWAWLGRIRCRLSSLAERLASRAHGRATVSTDCA